MIFIDTDKNLARGKENPVQVVINFDQRTKVRGIHATFHAAERTTATYTVTRTDSKGRTKTETRTAVEYIDIAKEEFLLFGDPPLGCLKGMWDAIATLFGGGKHKIVDAGQQHFDLSVQIPESSPPSFKGKKCEVFYRMSVQVDVPVKWDMRDSLDFEVKRLESEFDSNPVHVVFPDDSGRSFWDKLFGKNVTLNLALEKDLLACGEKAMAMLTVETPDPFDVNKISVRLIGRESSFARGHADGYEHAHELDDIESPGVISGESTFRFEVDIPQIDGPFTQEGTKFSIEWRIEVQLHIPWSKDPTISVPIKLVPNPPNKKSK